MDGGFRLLGHVRIDTTFRFANTAGIDHDEGFILIGRITIFTVTRQAGKVCDQSITTLGDLVKQR